jgi:hypothetical protein
VGELFESMLTDYGVYITDGSPWLSLGRNNCQTSFTLLNLSRLTTTDSKRGLMP